MKEFVEAFKKATGVKIKVEYPDHRPGDYAKVYCPIHRSAAEPADRMEMAEVA